MKNTQETKSICDRGTGLVKGIGHIFQLAVTNEKKEERKKEETLQP